MKKTEPNNADQPDAQIEPGINHLDDDATSIEHVNQEEFIKRMGAQRKLLEKMIDNITDSKKTNTARLNQSNPKSKK